MGVSLPTPENKAPPGVSRVPQFPPGEGRKEAEPRDPDCEIPVSCSHVPWGVSGWHVWKISFWRHARCSGIDRDGCCERGSPWLNGKELCSRLVMSATERCGEADGCHCDLGRPGSQISVHGAGTASLSQAWDSAQVA